MSQSLAQLPERLIPWYRCHRRELPWRQDRLPYHVWLSEIMLQQTRVEAVKGYYTRFLEELPDIRSLARCEDDRLQKLWEGLGYYSRVRNLKKAAQVICRDYGGVFPREYAQVRSLPGIGPYTAGAICSIAFGQPTPAVDGNVLRVLARLQRDASPIDEPAHRRRIEEALASIYPQDEPGLFTQALMELGATVCLPSGQPRCGDCPCRELCQGREDWKNLPVKLPKRAKKQEHRTVFLLECDGKFAIEKRPSRGLLAGLWQFPNVSGELTAQEAVAWAEDAGLHPRALHRQVDRTHIFTHIRWELRGYFLEVAVQAKPFCWVSLEQLDQQAALPTAFRQFREEFDHV